MNANRTPIVSIIVPTYNCKEYAKVCIEHILNQTYPYWELFLVNGASTDGTTELCDNFANQDNRITSIHDIDGLVQARNVGFEHATGDWIMYIDGDDWIDMDTLEKLIDSTQRYENLEVVFFNYVQDFNGEKIQKWKWECKEKEYLYKDGDCMTLSNHTLFYKSGISEAYNKIVRTDFARKHLLYHNKKLRQGVEGTEYTLRVFRNATRVLYVNEDFYHYRYNINSLGHKIDEKDAKYISEGFLEIYRYIENLPIEYQNNFKKALYERSLYALIAKAMSTYFNPFNKENIL